MAKLLDYAKEELRRANKPVSFPYSVPDGPEKVQLPAETMDPD